MITKLLFWCFIAKALHWVYLYIKWLTSPLNKIPGPPRKSFLFGAFFEILREPYMQPHLRWWNQLRQERDGQHIPLIHYTHIFGRQSVIVLDCDLIQQILTSPSSKTPSLFPKQLPLLSQLIGDGLVSLNNEKWSRHRRIIQPSFRLAHIRDALGDYIPQLTLKYIQQWKLAEGCVIDVASHFSAITLDVMGRVGFSYDFNALKDIKTWASQVVKEKQAEEKQEQEEEKEPLTPSTATTITKLTDPLINSLLNTMKPDLLRFLFVGTGFISLNKYLNPRARKTTKLLSQAVDKIVQDAKQKHSTTPGNNDINSNKKNGTLQAEKKKHRPSLLEMLFDANDGQDAALDDVELRDEIKTFLFAGHETTATWCYWAIYTLVKYPDIQQRVVDDITKHAPKTTNNDAIGLEQLDEMEYFHAFLMEVLRMYPPVGFVYRVNSTNVQLGEKNPTIPAGTHLVIPIYLLHHHEAYWDAPNEFRPERWLTTSSSSSSLAGQRKHAFAFLPFSGGGRNCIGQRFATLEAKLILAPIIREFRLALAPHLRNVEFTLTSFITVKSKPALQVVFKERKDAKQH